MRDHAVALLDPDHAVDVGGTCDRARSLGADGGGGEVASNVFVKGLPSGGQYQFTPLMYDGITLLSSFGLNSSAYDVYARNDLGIQRLEFVRGGVSNLFGPGSVAGLINYISKTGTDRLEGTVQLEVGQDDRYRGDVALSGPLGNNLYFAVAGFYRSDKGPLRTNLDTKGGQLRGNLEYRFADGSGNIKVLGQYINDQAQFYLPIPLNGTTRERLVGNDGKLVASGPAVLNNSRKMAVICAAVLNFASLLTGTLTRISARNSRRPETRISRQTIATAGNISARPSPTSSNSAVATSNLSAMGSRKRPTRDWLSYMRAR